jgi:hypothetical protein
MWREFFRKMKPNSFYEFQKFVKENRILFVTVFGREDPDYDEEGTEDYHFYAVAVAVAEDGFVFTFSDQTGKVPAKELHSGKVGEERKRLLQYMETMCDLIGNHSPVPTPIYPAYKVQLYARYA